MQSSSSVRQRELGTKGFGRDHVGGDMVPMRTIFTESLIKIWCRPLTAHILLFTLGAFFLSQLEPRIGFTSLQLTWRCDRPWEAKIQSVLILSPSPIGFDWPQHMHSNPNSTTNKSLSFDTIQEKVCSRSSAQTLSVVGPIYFGPVLSVTGCLTWRDLSVDRTELKTEGLNYGGVNLRVTFLCHSQIAGSHLWATCPHNYSHYTLSRSLFIVTFCHMTPGGKWHFIFYLQTISEEPLWLLHAPTGTCVLLKEPPINLWQPPINAERPLITNTPSQPQNICSDKSTEL